MIEENEKISLSKLVKEMWNFVPKKEKRKYNVYILLSIIRGITTGGISPFLTGKMVELGGKANLEDLKIHSLKNPIIKIGLFGGSAYFLDSFAHIFQRKTETEIKNMGLEIASNITQKMVEDYLKKDMTFVSKYSPDDCVEDIKKAIEAVNKYIIAISGIFASSFSTISATANVIIKNHLLGIGMIVYSSAVILKTQFTNDSTIKQDKEKIQDITKDVRNIASNLMKNIRFLQGFDAENYAIEKFENKNKTLIKDYKELNNKKAKKDYRRYISNFIATIASFGGLLVAFATGEQNIGDVSSSLKSISAFLDSTDRLSTYIRDINEAITDFSIATKRLREQNKITDKENAIDLQQQLNNKIPIIEFNNVSFAYPDDEKKKYS